MPVRALEAIGGFAAVRNVLAEDQVIGVRVPQGGLFDPAVAITSSRTSIAAAVSSGS